VGKFMGVLGRCCYACCKGGEITMIKKTGSAPITGTVQEKEDVQKESGISMCPKCGSAFLTARGTCPNCKS